MARAQTAKQADGALQRVLSEHAESVRRPRRVYPEHAEQDMPSRGSAGACWRTLFSRRPACGDAGIEEIVGSRAPPASGRSRTCRRRLSWSRCHTSWPHATEAH